MKIFSLETKKHLVIWSLLLGVFINYAITFKALQNRYNCASIINDQIDCLESLSWPFNNQNLDLLFWILVAFIVLSLLRHLRKQKV